MTSPHFNLDDIFWDNNSSSFGLKTSAEDRSKNLDTILQNKNWIIEGVYFGEWTKRTFEEADQIIVLSPNVYLQHWRVATRWLKRKFKLIPSQKKRNN